MKKSGILLAAVGAAGLMAAAKPKAPVKGVSYRVRTQTQMPNMAAVLGGGGGGDQPAPGGGRGFGGGGGQLVRIDMAGNRARVEFQLGAPPGSSITDYFLMLIDSNKVYRVNPGEQTFADATLGGVGSFGGRGNRGFGGFGGDSSGRGRPGNRGGRGGNGGGGDNPGRGGRGGGFVNPMQILQDLIITSVKVQTQDMGAGETIENRPTHRYLITGDYEFKLYGQPRSAKTTTEVWTIDFPMQIVDPFETATVRGDSMSYAGIASRLAEEEKKVPGVHVKAVTTQIIPLSMMGGAEAEVSASGQVAQTVSIVRTTTITALKEVDLDDETLKIPDGYKKVAGFGRPGGN